MLSISQNAWMVRFALMAVLAVISAVETARADDPAELLEGLESARFWAAPENATSETEDGVRRVNVLVAKKWHDVQLALRPVGTWSPDDTLVLSVECRVTDASEETGEGWMLLAAQQTGGPGHKVLRLERPIPREWTRMQFPFKATDKLKPDASLIIIGLGTRQQQVEVRSVSLTNHGDTPVNAIPTYEASYEGRAADAPWRARAAERIEKHRKADVAIRVVDAAGRPVPNAQVTIRQTRHAFGFGSAVSAELMTADTPEAEQYRRIVQENFSRVTLENALKWGMWAGQRQQALDALRTCREMGLEVRGHTLVWPSFKKMHRAEPYAQDPEQLARYINDHITDIVSTVGNLVIHWDVVNEPYANHDAMDVLGQQAMVEWFRIAKAANPDAAMYINDYNILTAGGTHLHHQDYYERTIRYLIDNGAPLDGIGMQGHFGSATPLETAWSILDRFSAFGKPVHITEFDFDGGSPQLQADYLRDLLTLCFSHPHVDGFVMWGFWAGAHWKPQCAMYDLDFSPRPAAQVWRDLVLNEWWTDLTVATDDNGYAFARVFKGDHTITGRSPAGEATQAATVTGAGTTELRIVLEPGS